ncbi:MAG: HAMP domain-containing histidine kinase [Planctomycetes bacterium]|nr:HAMP domain-containing histidine kinase [Planctomycetota bacterium]
MWRQGRYHISLARKISLLFGTAVLLTISATLIFPQLHMGNLNEQQLLMQAKWAASCAALAVDLQEPDWEKAQAQLDQRWSLLVRDLGVPAATPTLVPLGGAENAFATDAIERLAREAKQACFWQILPEERVFRFAMAVRRTEADVHPGALRGIIEVHIAVSPEAGITVSMVTVLAGASGAVLAILVFYLATQRLVLTPVTSLRRTAEQVAGGDMDTRAEIATGDEFQDLSEAFNNMLVHLKNAQEELKTTNRSLDIRLGELAETNVVLYESNRLKSEFLANVTHELRTPLVSIIGFAELLRDSWDNPDADRKRLARYSENILVSGRSLMEIINDLLDLAKIEAGKIDLHLSEFSIARLCRDLIDFVQPLADKKNQKLELRLARNLPRLNSDSGKIRQILYNLLSNAVKFTPGEGAILLKVEQNGERRVRLIVTDTGPGIPEEQRTTIFEKFRQLDSSKTREYEGTGLGLAITQELVHILGGTVHVDSEVGTGSTFTVELPVHVDKPADRLPIRLR